MLSHVRAVAHDDVEAGCSLGHRTNLYHFQPSRFGCRTILRAWGLFWQVLHVDMDLWSGLLQADAVAALLPYCCFLWFQLSLEPSSTLEESKKHCLAMPHAIRQFHGPVGVSGSFLGQLGFYSGLAAACAWQQPVERAKWQG